MYKWTINAFLQITVFLMIFCGLVSVAGAEVEWKILSTNDLKNPPLDIAVSVDGKSIFVLTVEEVVIYSADGNQVKGRIPVDKGVVQIAISPKGEQLFLTNAKTQKLSVLKIDYIQQIDISGAPFKGPANAPVVIALFDDYQ
jgi:DNA-binding beta-propeller fold protein YncE